MKSFGGGPPAVDRVDLDVEAGAFFALLGGSGCGKTTLLRMVAGFVAPGAGTIAIDGQAMAGLPPHRRPVNMMFQSYALFPHMSVADNVAFGLRREGLAEREVRARTDDALAMVRMGEFAGRRPDRLSGGQRQRVALARALVKRPRVLLLDEPLSALDRALREETALELARLQRALATTFVMVTHDQGEAMGMADRIAVMDRGRIVQVGTPADVYERPASRFVAGFVGSINLFEGVFSPVGGGRVALESPGAGTTLFAVGVGAGPGAIGVRPERIVVSAEGRLPAIVEAVAYGGARSLVTVRLAGGMRVRASVAGGVAVGESVRIDWAEECGQVFPGASRDSVLRTTPLDPAKG